jgi:hypothetical protein
MKQACSELNKYCQYAALLESLPTLSPPASTPSPALAPAPTQSRTPVPAARVATVSSQEQQQAINDQIQQAVQDALGNQGALLLQQLNMAAHAVLTENSNNYNGNNSNGNSYSISSLSCRLSSPHYAYRLAMLPILLFQQELLTKLNSIDSAIAKCNYIPNAMITINDTCKPSQAVIDSGATHTMTSNRNLFSSITYYDNTNNNTPKVMLRDKSTHLPVAGYGLMSFAIGGYSV